MKKVFCFLRTALSICLISTYLVEAYPLNLPDFSNLGLKPKDWAFEMTKDVFETISRVSVQLSGNVTATKELVHEVISVETKSMESNNPEPILTQTAARQILQEAVLQFRNSSEQLYILLQPCREFKETEGYLDQLTEGSKDNVTIPELRPVYHSTARMVANYVSYQNKLLEQDLVRISRYGSIIQRDSEVCHKIVSPTLESIEFTQRLVSEYLNLTQTQIPEITQITKLDEEDVYTELSAITLVLQLFFFFSLTGFVSPVVCFWTGYVKNGGTICERFVTYLSYQEFYIIMELVRRMRG